MVYVDRCVSTLRDNNLCDVNVEVKEGRTALFGGGPATAPPGAPRLLPVRDPEPIWGLLEGAAELSELVGTSLAPLHSPTAEVHHGEGGRGRLGRARF